MIQFNPTLLKNPTNSVVVLEFLVEVWEYLTDYWPTMGNIVVNS